MRPVWPHFDGEGQLRVVESERRPGLADALNGFVHGSAAFGPAMLLAAVVL